MKNKNKGKLEYVQEFRKITAIQKLPTLKQGFGDIFFQNKAENNKFLRLKDEPFLNEMQLNYRMSEVCENEYVGSFVFDNEDVSKQRIEDCMLVLNQEIQGYKNWAKQLTQYVQKGVYSYVFRNQRASPPVALTQQMKSFDPIAMQINNQTSHKPKTNRNKITQETVNMPNKIKRFDFNQITDYLMTDDFKQEDLDGNIDFAKKEFQLFREFKTIQQINQIEELKADYEKFEYHVVDVQDLTTDRRSRFTDSQNLSFAFKNHNNSASFAVDEEAISNATGKKSNPFPLPDLLKPTHTLQQKFKYLSLHKNHLEMNINYFRNLGPPSRNIEDFIKNIALNDEHTENVLEAEEEENPFLREKIDTCLLHFLEPKQLKMDKNAMNFYDIENIAMARITSTNSHMCIRSEKVTRLQYEKLLKKMEKLYKMQHEDGKTRVHLAISTDEVDEDTSNKRMRNDNNQNRLSLQKIVQEINAIRKQSYTMANTKEGDVNYKFIVPGLVKNEMSKKMFRLLEQLYARVSEQLPFKYSILEIGLHIDEIDGLADNYFETKKLIWFIMTVLEEIEKGKSVDKNISYLQNKNKKDDEPKVVKYKGQKVVAKDKMGTKNLFYNNPVSASTAREKSVSINNNFSKSPVKDTPNYNRTTTPIKNSTSRSPLKSSTYQQSQNKKTNSDMKTAAKNTSSPYNGSTAKKTTRY